MRRITQIKIQLRVCANCAISTTIYCTDGRNGIVSDGQPRHPELCHGFVKSGYCFQVSDSEKVTTSSKKKTVTTFSRDQKSRLWPTVATVSCFLFLINRFLIVNYILPLPPPLAIWGWENTLQFTQASFLTRDRTHCSFWYCNQYCLLVFLYMFFSMYSGK
jgi:hypothetical protein